jgi:pilus assembly protein CpaF
MKYSKTDLPREDLMEMLTEIDLIIYMEDYKCCELTEVAGWDESKKKPLFNSVFKYNAVKDKNSGSYNSEFVKIGDSCEKVMKKVKKAVVSGRLEVDGDVK